ncbi:MAG: hypothetical protein CEE40_01875 [Chloroflexi bacterium B3_Chlor]|nr:MAG: hypothetical protein CEE40_01875 [Chloroflexi bacterium B3_Chlor]
MQFATIVVSLTVLPGYAIILNPTSLGEATDSFGEVIMACDEASAGPSRRFVLVEDGPHRIPLMKAVLPQNPTLPLRSKR